MKTLLNICNQLLQINIIEVVSRYLISMDMGATSFVIICILCSYGMMYVCVRCT